MGKHSGFKRNRTDFADTARGRERRDARRNKEASRFAWTI